MMGNRVKIAVKQGDTCLAVNVLTAIASTISNIAETTNSILLSTAKTTVIMKGSIKRNER